MPGLQRPQPQSVGVTSPLEPADLIRGDLEILGLLAGSSNYTFLARLDGDPQAPVVYKPQRGETPLWDFPSGTLCHREVCAYRICAAAGWSFVPPTVLRDGPLGAGAVQRFVEHDPAVTAFDLGQDHNPALMRIALFDVIANNADRKAGHVLVDRQGVIWGIDHGLCFHVEHKLRTVLWDYIGEPIPDRDLLGIELLLEELSCGLAVELGGLLASEEVEETRHRAERLLAARVFPHPGPGRPYPWPPI
ncbi:MAG: SCO1664 family protein [Actinomycetota bacterium]